jgi:hypothetical protein
MTKDKALKMALEALEEVVKWYQFRDRNDEPLLAYDQEPEIKASIETIIAIKEALAQPEQKPVAWMNDSTPSGIFARHIEGAKNFGCTIPLYTALPQRTWVGLTDDEIEHLRNDQPWWVVRDIEAKLKDKNT